MAIAAEPPELPPMVARPSGSLVSFTLHCFSTRGSTSVSTNSAYRPDMVSYSRPRSLPGPSPLPLPIEMAIITGRRCWAIRLSMAVNNGRSGPSAPTRNGASVPGTYWVVGGAEDEVSVGVRRRDGAVGQLLGRDITGRAGIASWRHGTRRRRGRGRSLGDCRTCASHQADQQRDAWKTEHLGTPLRTVLCLVRLW